MNLYSCPILLCLYDDVLQILCSLKFFFPLHIFITWIFFIKSLCLRFYHLQKCVFYLWLLVRETGIYTSIMAMPL